MTGFLERMLSHRELERLSHILKFDNHTTDNDSVYATIHLAQIISIAFFH